MLNLTDVCCIAAVGGNASIASRLLRAGADINAVDKFGKTPLMLAVINGYQSLVELLLENDADVCVKNEVDLTNHQLQSNRLVENHRSLI